MLGERLKTLRGKKTQNDVAKMLGISRARYSHYENEIREPDHDMLNKIADLYEISVDTLLGRENVKTESSIKVDSREKDIAKRLNRFKQEIEASDGLAFDGEPMSEEAKESLLESMELLFRQTQRINKKYTPKKYLDDQ